MATSGDRRAAGARCLLPLLLCGITAGVLFPAVFLGRVFFLKDAHTWFYPSRLYLRSRVLGGDLPQWMPELDMGSPFLADPSHATFYPLHILLLLPAPGCVSLLLAVHVMLAAAGAYALLRGLHLGRAAAFVGGIGFGLGGYLLSMTWSGVYLLSVAWMPLVTLLCLRVVRHRRGRDVAFAGLALGCQVLTGEVQGVLCTAFVTLTVLLAEGLPWRRLLGGLALLGGVVLLALGLALPQVLPTLGLLSASTRAGGVGLEEASHWSFHPLRLLELLAPRVFGDPADDGSIYLGYFMNNEDGSTHRTPWMHSPYLGSLSLVLAAIGGFSPRKEHRRLVLAFALLGVVALLMSLGRHTPVFAALFGAVPGLDLFRYPAKYFVLLAFALPLLAAVGLEALLAAKGDGARRPHVVLVAAAIALGGVLLAALVAAPTAGRALAALRPLATEAGATATVRNGAALELALLTLAVAFLLLVLRLKPRWAGLAAGAALVVQIWGNNSHAAPTMDSRVYEGAPELARRVTADLPEEATPRLWRQPDLPWPLAAEDFTREREAMFLTESLADNTALLSGVGSATSYTPVQTPERTSFWRSTGDIQRPVLDLYSITHVVVPRRATVPEGIGLDRSPGADAVGVALYRNTTALPLCRPVHSVLPAESTEEVLHHLRHPAVLRGETVVLEDADGAPSPAREGAPVGTCRCTRPTGDEIHATCDLVGEGYLVVNESFAPGWAASLDGAPVAVHRANAIVMALPVPAGRHRVALEYGEPRLDFGLGCAGACLVACLALLLIRPRK